MNLEERIKSFAVLGEILRDSLKGKTGNYLPKLNTIIENQVNINPWFTEENVRSAVGEIACQLTKENLTKWTGLYPALKVNYKSLNIGLIMAGNIPLAGFHDFISVLISGNKVVAKTSSKDSELIVFIADLLISTNPEFRKRIEFTQSTLTGFDAIIATGSNNSSRYFEQYFGKYPHIIRKNRNSIGILEGNETREDLENLGNDIFTYFGLGCRNVSKLYIPKGYDISRLTNSWGKYSGIITHIKYANNYDYNKALFIVNKEVFHDSGYILLKEDNKLYSPVSVLNYEYFESQSSVKEQIDKLSENIQCIVGKKNVPFGQAQSPNLWNYADGIDTVEFLLKKNSDRIL
jgi:hypothetical protein